MTTVPCPLCATNANPFLQGRPDLEYGVPQQLHYFRCTSRDCGLVFAHPIPEELIPSFYGQYTTHLEQSPARTTVLTRWSRQRTLRDAASAIGPPDHGGIILDYGCGNGQFLRELKDFGYRQLAGYDFDPKARDAARRVGARVVDSEEELGALGPFRAIVMNHVVEHLANPVADLRRLSHLLAPRGRIVIRTPNCGSGLCRVFGSGWRGWETPRHLNIFNPRSVNKMLQRAELSSLTIERTTTTNTMYFGIFHGSFHRKSWLTAHGKMARHLIAFATYPLLTAFNRLHGGIGEEVVAVVIRRA
jgi:2-polyprenyl-3-methyl-5-hydroxy-6-metoxy-1,4-benzoquinol methylase